ncbi:MAG: hypothetical protein WCV84_00860 [Patescibacteria group bacterium]
MDFLFFQALGTTEVVSRREVPVKRGAYVPHSNDGGYFIRRILPEL